MNKAEPGAAPGSDPVGAGAAVPPPMGRALGLEIRKAMLKKI